MKTIPLVSLIFLSATVHAEVVDIRPAVEPVFPTVANRAYQVEASGDLAVWNAYEHALVGSTGTVHLFASAGVSSRFFQVAAHDVRDLNDLLEPIRAANKVPGLACAVVLSNRIVGLGAVGLRKANVPAAPVTVQDIWHHGSNTKSMTATLAAILVEKGKIAWSTTLAEVFPSFAAKMHPQWRDVPLDWLCSNRSGAPEDLFSSGIWDKLQSFEGTPKEGRQLLLELLTVRAPNSTPGTKYEYSNAGFTLAGHMLETVAGQDWEQLLTEQLFVPLGMTTAGFGVPARPRFIDQPWGHQWINGVAVPVEPGPSADNPPTIGPAGTMHGSVVDMAKYMAFHLAGHRSGTDLLGLESFIKLHTAVTNNANYAYGWNAVDRPWAKGKALHHNGSNLMWYSVIWMAPNVDFGVIAVCNVATGTGANPGATATDQVAAKMIQTFLQ